MYVFGIDMPIMEILFIILVFYFIAIIFIWVEIRKMSSLLKFERSELKELNEDISAIQEFMEQESIKKRKTG